ncbi:MAG TPA: glycoside hydrolase family 28 protein, partial [Capsulimonadaceae bacterium]|nr:glycoside hydrolase family 28 protein [Capsulimonadaceae bacterium]
VSPQLRAAQPAVSIPNRTFDIRHFGAVGNGKMDNTQPIARAIAACASAGGGHVIIPAGGYLTGPIKLRSNIDLHVNQGALVLFSTDHSRYPFVLGRYQGVNEVHCISPLYGEGLHNVEITGPGVFDGQGQSWRPEEKIRLTSDLWQKFVASGGYLDQKNQRWWPSRGAFFGNTEADKLRQKGDTRFRDYLPYRDFLRPCLLELVNCRNVVLDGPTFQNSPFWTVHLLFCDQATVRNITSFNYRWAINTDGIDIDSCRHVRMTDCVVNSGDDGIAIKSGKDEDGRRDARPSQDIQIDHCTVYRAHGGLVIGSDMSGGVRDVRASDCYFDGTDIGLRFKTVRGRGGLVDNVSVDNIDMQGIDGNGIDGAAVDGVAISFDMYYYAPSSKPEPVSARTPIFRHFRIANVNCDGAKMAIYIHGLEEMPIQDISFIDVHLKSQQGVVLIDAKQISMYDLDVQADTSPSLIEKRVSDLKEMDTEGLTEAATGSAAQPSSGRP